ncbi:hypothetical protein [Cardinium endosymbiont of Sogatella furcifera]|uniref:hypothetical protein n=1 Tax=Cardinium endosymbiont of Sogatella furcifera TaxID=650378 RepID=UPI000E0D0D4A|nr:hypothetical protein [Cardinium endosymbiont of Sogatella furcifera]
MKKKHMQYRSSLLIGLLSLNTLSACVHTKQGLGMDDTPGRQEEQNDNRDNIQVVTRPSLVRTAFLSTVELLAEMSVEDLLWFCSIIYGAAHTLGYAKGYYSGYAKGILHTYLESEVSK